MAYHSLVKLRGAAGQSEFAFDFPYMKEGDIYVFVEGAAASFTFTSPQTIQLDAPLKAASDVIIRRYTEIDERLVDYSNVSELDEITLDTDSIQGFYLAQEAYDIGSLAIVTDTYGNWDVKGGRIINVADAIEETDALNLRSYNRLTEGAMDGFSALVAQAEAAADRAEDEADRAEDEADQAEGIKNQTQGIHDATADIKVQTEQVYVETVNERTAAEEAAVLAQQWAEESQYWYDIFRTTYYGARADHPTGSVIPGAMYFNTTFSRLYIWSGVEWYSPTDDADRAETAREVTENLRNEAQSFRDQAGVYAGQAQDAATQSQDSANAAAQAAGASANSAAEAANHETAAEYSAADAKGAQEAAAGHATDAAQSAAEAAEWASQVHETFGDAGTWYVSTGLPAAPSRSSMWTVADGGELNGVNWGIGDMLVFSTHTNAFGRLTGDPVTGEADPDPIDLDNGAILGEGAALKGWAQSVLRWIAYVDADAVRFGDTTLPVELVGTVATVNGYEIYHTNKPPAYSEITGKPSTFPPAAHQHAWGDVTEKPVTATRWPTYFEVTDKPVDYPPSAHSHTPAEIGAVNKAGDSMTGKLTATELEGTLRHTDGYLNIHPYNSGYGTGRLQGYFREHDSDNPDAGYCGLLLEHRDADNTATKQLEISLGGKFVYHQGRKPTAADVGAVALDGSSTMTGDLKMGGKKIVMGNANIEGINGLVFSDTATSHSEGIRWPTSDAEPAVFDGIHAAGGHLYFNDTKKVYHEGHKPTAADVGALPKSGGTLEGGLTLPQGRSLTIQGDTTEEDNDPSMTLSTEAGYAMMWRNPHPSLEVGKSQEFIGIRNDSAIIFRKDKGLGDSTYLDHRVYHEGFKQPHTIGTPTELGANVDLDTVKTPGVYSQSANAETSTALHYPEANAGSLVVYQAAGIVQEYRVYNSARIWVRAQYGEGTWTAWARQYNTANKPTAADVGAFPQTGGSVSGVVSSTVVSGQTDGGCAFAGSSTGGALAEMYRRNGVYHANVTHQGSSYAPVLSTYFLDAEGWDGKWSQGVLGAPGASADDWAVHYKAGSAAGGSEALFTFKATGVFHAPDVYISSDKRLKSNLVPLRGALDKISALTGYSYDKKSCLTAASTTRDVGLLADDVLAVLPEAVLLQGEDEIKTISPSALVAVLVEAVKELSVKVGRLEHGRAA